MQHKATLAPFLRSFLLLIALTPALCFPALAQDDPDTPAGWGGYCDQAYDDSGALIQATAFGSTGQLVSVQRSLDHGQTWTTLFMGGVESLTGQIFFIRHISLDLAYDISTPALDDRVFVCIAGTEFDKRGNEKAFVGVLSGSSTTTWPTIGTSETCTRVLPIQPFIPPLQTMNDAHTSVAVMPNPKGTDYIVGVAYTYPEWLSPYAPDNSIYLGYSLDHGASFPIDYNFQVTGRHGELDRVHADCGHPSMVFDRVNQTWLMAYHGTEYTQQDVVVCRANPFAHSKGKGSIHMVYQGNQSNTGSKVEQHHPVIATDNNIVVFTCLTGNPNPKDGSYRLTAFWGSAFTLPWEDAFLEVNDFLWMRRGFHDKAVSAADLDLRGDTLHFTANCIVDPNGASPGTGILQFTSDMIFPSESTVMQVNDHPVKNNSPAPKISATDSAPFFESVVYSDINMALWLDM